MRRGLHQALLCIMLGLGGGCASALPRRSAGQGPFGAQPPTLDMHYSPGVYWAFLAGLALGGLGVWLWRKRTLALALRRREGSLGSRQALLVKAALEILEEVIRLARRKDVVVGMKAWLRDRGGKG